MNNLTQYQIGYIAGFFDGEGNIVINRRTKNNEYFYGVNVDITNTNLASVERIREWTRAGNIIIRDRKPERKITYGWYLHVHQMSFFLKIIEPYCFIKKERVLLMLQFISILKCSRSKPITIQQMALKELIYEEMRELNKRGR